MLQMKSSDIDFIRKWRAVAQLLGFDAQDEKMALYIEHKGKPLAVLYDDGKIDIEIPLDDKDIKQILIMLSRTIK